MHNPTVTFARLPTVDPADLIDLMNDPQVRRHLPLAHAVFGPADCARFVAAKEAHWAQHGFGHGAFFVEGAFAGWGGLEVEGEDLDLGLVLHPRYWGLGRQLYAHFAAEAFGRLGARSVTVLLPPSRRHLAAVARAGFVPDGEVVVGDARFRRFRLVSPSGSAS